MRVRLAMAVSLAAVLATAALAGGCARLGRPASAAWPVAVSERTVPMPADLLKWPLTGRPAPSDAARHSRVVSVKIENAPAARPQTALDQADVVYETLTEGGITRFNAIFQSQVPAKVGPVRSARLSDTNIVPQYAALFAHAGGNTVVRNAVRAAGIQDLDYTIAPEAYRRDSSRSAPHNLYTSIPKLRAAGLRKGYPATQDIRPFTFRSVGARPSGSLVARVSVPFSTFDRVSWTRAGAGARAVWLRADNGTPARDLASGARVSSENVVVLWARIVPTAKLDKNGVPTLEIGLNGTGRAAVFRSDGARVNGTWSTDGSVPPALTDAQGRAIPLVPGRTWFEVVPNDLDITFK